MKKQTFLHLILLLITYSALGQNAKLGFVKNKGQWDNKFEYKCNTGTGDLFIHSNAITYSLAEQGAWDKIDGYKHGQIKTPPTIKFHAYKMEFLGCQASVINESKIQKHYYNYFLGNDSTKWKSNIHPALALDYKELYKGIDLHLSSEESNLKYDFIVAPNADPNQIKLKFDGVEKLSIARNGSLVIYTSLGELKELKPVLYQYLNDQKKSFPCAYPFNKNAFSYTHLDVYKPPAFIRHLLI